ncbi:MAG: hypothetical protein IMF20_05220 [Proteobacteria bacterium]|nr:hypothetical protein [Pseudomonadota bacterium]
MATKLLIIGGVAGGATAAARARMLAERIDHPEKTGTFTFALFLYELPPLFAPHPRITFPLMPSNDLTQIPELLMLPFRP